VASPRQLTPGQVQIIRTRYVPGCRKNGGTALSEVFGINPTAIRDVATGRTYRDVSGDTGPVCEGTLDFVRQWVLPRDKFRGWNTFAKLLGVHPKALRALVKN